MLNDPTPPPNGAEEQLTPLQRAAVALKELRTRLDAVEQANREPIAVVGMACRFPGGGTDPAAFWQALRAGVDGVSEVPRDRWDVEAFHDPDPDSVGKHSSRYGSFLPQVDRFDAAFFAISPREATLMDPQQRLLLEVSWEALENAAIPPERLRGGPTGIFVGMMYQDYALLTLQPELMDIYTGTGQAMSVAAGRIAYFLGVHGPALTVDTSCSSSLVAVHLACQALRQGDCTTALAAGVNLILTPHHSISESRARMLAPDGRCKSFDAAADGFGRGEGCGVVVLKRLSQARADGDTILALVRGSAVNHDGRTSGLTVPNEQAQAAVIRQALAKAQIPPDQIGYIEAHGTGTSLGDPIEVGALAQTFGQRSHPLYLGSVKSNFGHLEGAAGIVAFIKTALLLHHGEIPPHLHLRTPNPHIPWADLPFVIPTARLPWPDGQPRLAGVSSFGASGTNAHLILEGAAAPPPPAPDTLPARPTLLTVSAADEVALQALAGRYADHLNHASAPFATFAAASWLTRAHLPVRATVLAADSAEAHQALRALAEGQRHRAVLAGQSAPTAPAVAFLFTGQGSQQHGMGRLLYKRLPTFRAAFDECAAALRPLLPHPLAEVLWGDALASHLETLPYAQAALFALQYALQTLWKAWGISPTWLLGHSAGEYAAACVASVLSVPDALRLMVTRGQLAHALPAAGAMAVVFAGEEDVLPLLEPESGVVLAAINGPENLVLSGPDEAMNATLARLQAASLRVRRLPIAQAFHAPHIAPIVAPFAQVARTISYQQPTQRVYSTLLGGPATTELATPHYWSRHLREPVRFAAALRSLAQAGPTLFLEIGPASTLLSLGRQSLPDARYRWLPSLRPNQEWEQLLTTLATLYTLGADICWQQVAQDLGVEQFRVPLPTYPWQRERYWVAASASASPATSPVLAALHQPSPDALVQLLAGDEPLSDDQRAYLHTLATRLRTQHQQPKPAPREATPQWGYTLAEENQPLDGAAALLPTPALLVADLPPPPALTSPDLAAYGARLTALEERSQFWASRAVQELGTDASALLPRYQRLLARLKTLANGAPSENSPLPPSPESELLERCGPRLAAVLRGEQDPLALLFPDGDLSLATHLYQETPVAQAMNALVRATVERALAAVPPYRRLRILEIGAGTGGTTAALLPHLAPDRVTYTITDLGASFLSHTEARFGSYPFVCFQRLDIEQEPTAQGFAPHGYDLILAANVLHATRDLRQTLRHVQHLLAPAGLLVLLEGTAPQGWLDLTFGLTEGWWRFEDLALRSDYPLLSSPQWRSLLQESGFVAAQALEPSLLAGAPPAAALVQQALLLAQAAPPAPAAPRHWLLLGEARGIGSALAARLHAAGDTCTHFPSASAALPMPAGKLAGIVHLAPLSTPPTNPPAATRAVIEETLPLVQHLLTHATPPPLWLVTSGAVTAQEPGGVAHASLWGLHRVLSHEHPDLPCTLLDLPLEADPAQAAAWLHDELLAERGESQLLYRQGERRGLRLLPWQPPAAPPPLIRADGSYLISGAFGGLGPLLARWLVARGARSLILVGRRGPAAAHAPLLDEFRAAGVTAQAVAVDIADPAQVSQLLASVKETLPPLRGIIHGAGTLDDGALPSLTPARFETVLTPKLRGAWNLHEQTRHEPLDFFVLLSSAAALLGNRGQANHAAANAALDALAHHRRALALPALTLNLGAVGEVGAAATHETEARLREQGIRPIAPARFVEWFEQALAAAPTQVAILTMDWTRFHSPSPLFTHLAIAAPEAAVPNPTPDWEATSPTERLARLEQAVTEAVQHVLRLDPQQRLPATTGFFALGMDSLTSVELRNQLQTRLGLRLPATLAFDHPTVERLVAHLAETLTPPTPPPDAEPTNGSVAEVLSSLADLSDDDIYARLAASS